MSRNDLDESLEDGRRGGLLSYIADHPHTTVADILASEAAGDVLKTLTFEELGTALSATPTSDRPRARRATSPNGRTRPAAKRRASATRGAPKNGSEAKASASGGLNLRTIAAREEYQSAMLEFLQEADDKVSAVELRQAVGGSEAQVRSALKALESQGHVDHAGKTAATRYWAT